MNKEKLYTNKVSIVVLATICCILWGSAYPAIKVGYKLFNIATDDTASKLVFAGYRFFLAGIIVLLYLLITKNNIFVLNKKDLGKVTLLGILQTTLQYTFFYIGLSYTTGVRGSILNGVGTFFSIILAHFIYRDDKLNFNKIVGCIIGFIGVIIVNISGGIGSEGVTFKGEGLIILAALMLSISSIYSKRITKSINSAIATGYQLSIGGLILLVVGLITGGNVRGFTVQSSLLLIYMALISSVAFVIWTQLIKYNKVGVISVFNFLIPVFGTLLSGIFLGENIFDIKILISLFMVSFGIYFTYRNKNN